MRHSRNAIQPGIPIMAVKACLPLFILALISNSSALAQTADLRVHAIATSSFEEPIEASDSVQGSLSTTLRTQTVTSAAGAGFGTASASVQPDLKILGFARGVAVGFAESFGANASVSIHGKFADFVKAGDDGSQNILLPPVELSAGGEGSASAVYRFVFFETNSNKIIAQGSVSDGGGPGFSVTGDFVEEDFTVVGPHQGTLLSDITKPIDVSQITPGADLTLGHSWIVSGNSIDIEGGGQVLHQ